MYLGNKEAKLEAWLLEAIEMMARTGMSLAEAAAELNIIKTPLECETILRRKSFHRMLRESRNRYNNERATDPNFKKDTIVGRLISLSQKLEDEGAFDKAAEAVLKAAKVAGFVGPESTVSVFGSLSQADLDAIRKKLEGDVAKATRVN